MFDDQRGNKHFIEHMWLMNPLAPVLYYSDVAVITQQAGILLKYSRTSRQVRSKTGYTTYLQIIAI